MAESFGIDTIELKQDIWIVNLEAEQLIELTRNRLKKYLEIAKYPAVTRDISFLISNQAAYSDIESCIKAIDSSLISGILVFDEYRGKQIPVGFRSMSVHIRFQDKEKTLTDERVDQLVESIIKTLQDLWQITMR